MSGVEKVESGRVLLSTYPSIAAEWHPTLNTLKPTEVTTKSSKSVWWIDSLGHEWKARVYNRFNGNGCPICSGRRILVGFNDLATVRPDIAAEWHPTLNTLKPTEVTVKSSSDVWWIDSLGREWKARVYNRSNGSGYPQRPGRRTLVRAKDLVVTYPSIAAEWHPTLNEHVQPSDVFSNSSTKVWWLCPQGHSYDVSPGARCISGRGCPICSGKRILVGFNDLAAVKPDIAAEWHPTLNTLKPTEVTANSAKSVWWIDSLGHEWKTQVHNRSNGHGCPQCSGNARTVGVNDLTATHPEIAAEWHPTLNDELSVHDVGKGSEVTVWWLCPQGHDWKASPLSRIRDARKCDVCSGRTVIEGTNDLATTHPEIAAEWHPTLNDNLGVTPHTVHAKTTLVSPWWLCSTCHQAWRCSLNERTVQGRVCDVCSGRRAVSGINDLATTHPAITAMWDRDKNGELAPENTTARFCVSVSWKCSKGHEWVARPWDVSRGAGFCPTCLGKTMLTGFNDLATRCPEVASEWHPTRNGDAKPSDFYCGSVDRAWWQCPQGHEWNAKIANRFNGSRCPTCFGNVSRGESEVFDVISKWFPDAIQSTRKVIAPYELDIFIPSKNFAIEFNGLYWHNEGAISDRDYHMKKTIMARDAGIHLVHVWEDDWTLRREIVIRSLAHRLGVTDQLSSVLPGAPALWVERVGARELTLASVSHKEASAFLEENHIQGSASGAHHCALFDSNARIRALITVKRVGGENPSEGSWSIERYATAGIVPGGFTRLLAFAGRTIVSNGGVLKKWVTFADMGISDGGLYAQNGFFIEKTLAPDYRYVVRALRVHKFNYRVNRFRVDPTLQYVDGYTERELAALNGISRIWDAGKERWVKIVNA